MTTPEKLSYEQHTAAGHTWCDWCEAFHVDVEAECAHRIKMRAEEASREALRSYCQTVLAGLRQLPDVRVQLRGHAYAVTRSGHDWHRIEGRKRLPITNTRMLPLLDTVGIEAAVEAYQSATGSCSLCGRQLTATDSVHRGMGPRCFTRWSSFLLGQELAKVLS